MSPGLCLLLGLLILGAEPGTAAGQEGAHPGVCPRFLASPHHVRCPNACSDDRGCPPEQKCCFTGCGLGCVMPLGSSSSDFPPPGEVDWSLSQAEETHRGEPQKPGTCPQDFGHCLHLEPPLCTNDSLCPGWHKCCPHGCRLRCTPPAEGRGAADTCHLPAAPGPCGGRELRFFYNVTSGRCGTFPYGGCGGNPNNFGTRAACHRACLGHEKPKPGECPAGLPGLPGPCQEECGGDSDCPGSQKCCNSSCGNQCLPPAPARKAGFCPASAGLFPSYDCREWCQRDADCPGAEKCCLRGCDSVCLRPAREKPGICPLTEAAPWTQAPCQASCAEDGQCPGDEKCCSSRRCGRVCLAPERDKPGQCPKVRPRQAPEPCAEEDACGHDRDCPRQEKCCFGGCAMRCTRPAREHPGECPRAEPCWDPRRRHRSQCLDDSACRRDQKCCSSGCAWVCVAVAVPGGSGEHCACWAATHRPCSQLGLTAGGCARREPGRSPRAVRAGVCHRPAVPPGTEVHQHRLRPCLRGRPWRCCVMGEQQLRGRKVPLFRDTGWPQPQTGLSPSCHCQQ
ncbi:uncharacterized protein [Anas acuta]|uniref:uncharacterized protein isoform X3 n=1 Tax=Anas acuta TaxID=28680 RepID=UPI0035C93C4A